MLGPIFLRKERTTDTVTLRYCSAKYAATCFDVQAYADAEGTRRIGRWPYHYSNKPRKGCRRTMLDCVRWQCVWLPDAV